MTPHRKLPTLLVSAPLRQIYVLSERAFDRLLLAILLLSAAIVLFGASYSFRLVGVEDIVVLAWIGVKNPLGLLSVFRRQ